MNSRQLKERLPGLYCLVYTSPELLEGLQQAMVSGGCTQDPIDGPIHKHCRVSQTKPDTIGLIHHRSGSFFSL